MTDLQRKQLDFLNDTINFYNRNNRGLNENGLCSYVSGCSIGRHIDDKELCEKLDTMGSVDSEVFEVLPKFLQDLGVDFLREVQFLHDSGTYWNDEGLSERGDEKYNEIKFEYGLCTVEN